MSIIKVQRPIAGNGEDIWLVYDQLRARECFIFGKDIPENVKQELSTSFKGFYEGVWDQEKATWIITGKRLRERKW